MADNALHSLYGEGHLRAARTRECVAMPGVRDQVVLTPQPVIDGLLTLWPSGVAYDPAHAPGSLVAASGFTRSRGLLDPWPDRTYCNPPYGECLLDPDRDGDAWAEWIALKESTSQALAEAEKMLRLAREAKGLMHNGTEVIASQEALVAERKAAAKAATTRPANLKGATGGLWSWLEHQIKHSEGESVLLVPNRTNRKWLREWRRSVAGLVELDPLPFHGQKSAFPAPLVLGFVGPAARVPAFHRAFSHLGDPA